MDPADVSNVFATVLILTIVGIGIGSFVPRVRHVLAREAPKIAAAIAIGATLGSLYYSEVADYLPCRLCWFQRIAMYPLAVILPMGLVFKDRGVLRYALALASIGFAVAAYHVQLQWFPEQDSNACELTNPCTAKWVEAFGTITIPQMAGLSFLGISVLCVLALVSDRRSSAATSSD